MAPSEVAVESLIHTRAENVLSFLCSGSGDNFQRDSIMVEEGEAGEGRRVVLWTFLLERAGKIVEWILRMVIKKYDGGGYIVVLNSVKDESELPEDALDKLTNLRTQRRRRVREGDVVQGLMKDCLLSLRNRKYDQSSFSIFNTSSVCTIGGGGLYKEVEGKSARLTNLTESLLTTTKRVSKRLRASLRGLSNEQAVLTAMEGIRRHVFEHFEDSSRVDEERHKDTIEEITKEEGGQLADPQEKAFMEETKKMLAIEKSWKCVSHEGATPIRISKLKEDGDSMPWCKAETVIHTSAKRLLAYLLNFDSIERTNEHKNKHGKLLRCMHVDGEGRITDPRHFFYCVKVPNVMSIRRFEVRVVWDKENSNNGAHGGAVYRLAWCPAFEVTGMHKYVDRIKMECGFDDQNSFLANSILAKTRGIYELREVSANVTEVTMIRHDDIQGTVPAAIKEIYLTNAIKSTMHVLQKKHERNESMVDSEVRQALAETMRKSVQDVKLTAEQEEIFKNLDGLKEEGKGWNALLSSTPDISMWIKYNQQKKGERSIATGKAEGIVDCTAEEVAALFFDLCSIERMRIRFEEGDLAQLQVTGRHERLVNEKIFGTVRKVPFPLTNREFVIKYIWRVNEEEGSVSVGVWPADDLVDYGRNMGKTVRGAIKGLFTATNIPSEKSIGNQCRVTYYMVADAGGYLPVSLMNLKLPNQLMGLKKLAIDKFRRDEEVSEHHAIQVHHRESIFNC